MKSFSVPLVLSALAGMAAAKTNLEGCTSSATVNQWDQASMIWYVPGTGEICEFLDCGGGRAPARHDVPGCAQYTGTATYEPDYLPGYGPGAKPTATGPTSTGKPAATGTDTSMSQQTSDTTSTPKPSGFTTKCNHTMTMTSSRSLITPPPKVSCSSSHGSSSVPTVPVTKTAPGNYSSPSVSTGPSASITLFPSNDASVPGFSTAGAILVVAAFMGVAL